MYRVEERWRGPSGGEAGWVRVSEPFASRDEAEAALREAADGDGADFEHRVVEVDERGYPVTVDPSRVCDA